mgnify:CR=1 FL=1|jgi:hypothetical protein
MVHNLLDSELAALHPVSNSVRMENTWDLDIEDGGGGEGVTYRQYTQQ